MLILPQQFELLGRLAFAQTLKEWTQELRQEYPHETSQYSDAQFEERVAKASATAEASGMTSILEIRECLALMIETGIDANGQPTTPWLREILESPDLSAPGKFAEISAHLAYPDSAAQDLEALAQAGDSGAGESSASILGFPGEPDLPVARRFHTEPEAGGTEDKPGPSW